MRRIPVLYLFAVLLFPTMRPGAVERPPEVIEVVARVRTNFHRIKTIQGKIKRELVLNRQREVSEGFFSQEVPHKVNLEYTTTPRQKIITDGKTLWIYSLEKKEVVRFDNLTKEELATMQRFDFDYLLDEIMESPDYRMKVLSRNDNIVVLAAKPLRITPLISRILIKVDTEHGKILAYETFADSDNPTNQIMLEEYREYNGEIYYPGKVVVKSLLGPDKVMVQTAWLRRLIFNEELPQSGFQFTIPEGVRVLSREELQTPVKR